MAGKVVAFSGFGAWSGIYGCNAATGDADIVMVQLTSPGQQNQCRISRVAVHVMQNGVQTASTGFYTDWAVVTGNLLPNAFALPAPFSGGAIGPGTFGYGYNWSTPPTYGSKTGIVGVQRVLCGGRTYVGPAVNSAPYTNPSDRMQYVYPSDASAPQGNVGDQVTLLLLAPQVAGSTLAGDPVGANPFIFHVDVQGIILPPSAPQLGGYGLVAPNPGRTS